jgi:curli biogenesis system outer membrane secretion channel CsgG
MDLDNKPMTQPYATSLLKRNIKPSALALAFALALTGCEPPFGATTKFDRLGPGEAPVVIGPPVRDNFTPMNPALACLSEQITQAGQPKLTIAVDDIKDYTGQYSINEGDAITQGGSLMVMSALGKLGGAVNVADRFNTDVTEMELGFMNQRELGDGTSHTVGDGPGQKAVPWIPYYGGSIMASRYYITGGITELNYNVQSGGVQFQVNQIGPEDRVYTEDVGIDLELVDTQTLLVVKSVSLVKQITGYEVGFNIFQFFGSNLYNLNIGNKSQEPAQLAVRTLLEEGVLRLVAAAENLPPGPCLSQAKDWIPQESAEDFLKADQTPAAPAQPPVAQAEPAPQAEITADGGAANVPATVATQGTLNASTAAAPLQNGNMGQAAGPTEIKFDYGASDVTGGDMAELDQAAAAARVHQVQMILLVPANEDWAPSKRTQLANARISAVQQAMRIRGIMHVAIAWTPDASSNGFVMDDSGYQKVALLVVSQ